MAAETYGLPLFPIPMGVYNLGEAHQRQDRQLVTAILQCRCDDHNGVQGSQVGGWHSGNIVDEHPAFEELCTLVQNYAKDYAARFGVADTISVPGCWANINERGAYNMPHHHNGSTLAGVYYPCQGVTPDGDVLFNYAPGNPVQGGAWGGNGGELVIQSPHYGLYHGVREKDNPFTVSHYHVNPQSGILLLFPPYLIHSVTPVMDDNRRLSISFRFGKC